MEYDAVKKPAHYTEGRQHEPKDVIRDWGLNFNLGNAVKYIARAGRKDDIVQELKKAQEYIQFEIDAIEEERKKAVKPKECAYEVIKVDVPKGSSPEDIIMQVIEQIYRGV